MNAPVRASAAQKTVGAMRKDILATGADGHLLGSEDDLLVRYGVSRPTMRQALRVLESEQLLFVRRGVNGGVFTRLPTSDAVAQVAAVFLQANGTTIRELQEAVRVMSPVIARKAASNPSAEARGRLLEWVLSYQDNRPHRPRDVVALAAEFGRRIADLSGSPPLALFHGVLMRLALGETDSNLFTAADRIDSVHTYHLALARAVGGGHAGKAERLARENIERTHDWVPATARVMRRAGVGR